MKLKLSQAIWTRVGALVAAITFLALCGCSAKDAGASEADDARDIAAGISTEQFRDPSNNEDIREADPAEAQGAVNEQENVDPAGTGGEHQREGGAQADNSSGNLDSAKTEDDNGSAGAAAPDDGSESTGSTESTGNRQNTDSAENTDDQVNTGRTENADSEKSPEDNTGAVTYTVTFKDYDGTMLAVQQVNAGENAPLPADPVRSGFVFAGWQGSYQNVNADSSVTAVYVEKNAANLFLVESGALSDGKVSVTVRLGGSICVCGVECRLDYDESVLRYESMTKHNSVEANDVSLQDNRQVAIVWANTENVTNDTIRDDGILLELVFDVLDPEKTDTVFSFFEDGMHVDTVDENGSYHSGSFTLTKGVVHLK